MAEEEPVSSLHDVPHGDVSPPNDTSGDIASSGGSDGALFASIDALFATLGDAEDAVIGFLADLLDDIFADMRVKEENARALSIASASAWRQALGSCLLAAAAASASLDSDSRYHLSGQRHQFLRPRADEADTTPTRRPRRLNRVELPVVEFLSELWRVIDKHDQWVEGELARFPGSRFHVSAVPTRGRQGEWEIAVSDLRGFLQHIVRSARLSVLSSAVDFVAKANATLLAKKARAKNWLQLTHIALCVQTALLQTEEELHRSADEMLLPKVSRAVFQTELVRSNDTAEDDLFVCYDEGGDAAPPDIDRNATGSVAHKTELATSIARKERVARSVVALMQRRTSDDGKWGVLRKRLLVRDQHVGIGVEADMEISAPEVKKSPTAIRARLSPNKKASVAVSPRAGLGELTASKRFVEPDAATLSNIFSLGTPRQLSADELARRNDILTLLERDEASVSRRMAVASITQVSVPPPCVGSDGKPLVSDQDKAFQAYVAANSSITMTRGSCLVPSVGNQLNPEKQEMSLSLRISSEPKRNQEKAAVNGKTKFELALEAPRFDVSEGNYHARMAAAAAAEAVRRARSRGGMRSPVPMPHSPGTQTEKLPVPHNQPRPIETASGHLPQLDTSRLAVGVKAVIRGVEKRGPWHDPSRNSRLRLHNYTSTDGGFEDPEVPNISASPDKKDHLPPVSSPMKASPHRKHVAFPVPSTETIRHVPPAHPSPQRPPAQEWSPAPPNGLRRFPAKQPTFEKRTSPPRVRNRFLTENANNNSGKKHFAKARWKTPSAVDEYAVMNAPRRNLAYGNEIDDD